MQLWQWAQLCAVHRPHQHALENNCRRSSPNTPIRQGSAPYGNRCIRLPQSPKCVLGSQMASPEVIQRFTLASPPLLWENVGMHEVRGSFSTVADPQGATSTPSSQMNSSSGGGAFTPSKLGSADSILELLQSAKVIEEALRSGSADVSQQAAAQGRVDALESVTGSNSLARGAAEVAAMIRMIEIKMDGMKSQQRVEKKS